MRLIELIIEDLRAQGIDTVIKGVQDNDFIVNVSLFDTMSREVLGSAENDTMEKAFSEVISKIIGKVSFDKRSEMLSIL